MEYGFYYLIGAICGAIVGSTAICIEKHQKGRSKIRKDSLQIVFGGAIFWPVTLCFLLGELISIAIIYCFKIKKGK